MKHVLIIIFLVVTVFYVVRLGRILSKMKEKPILPQTEEERKALRLLPEKTVDFPRYANQRKGIVLYVFSILFFPALIIAATIFDGVTWFLYLYFTFSMMYTTSYLLNIFAVMDSGILCGKGFIPWKRIQSYSFETIDLNHRFYGYAKEVNHRFELKLKTRYSAISCIVVDEEVKDQMEKMLKSHIKISA